MKNTVIILCVLLCTSAFAQNASRQTVNFDRSWKFSLDDASNAQDVSYNDGSWRVLNVPHDWSVELPNTESEPGGGNVGNFPMGIGWYRKTFDVPGGLKKDSKWSIEFDGVYQCSTVWVNGHELGFFPYGYSGFSYDLTPYLKSKGNVIAVRVDNSAQPNSRWYTGSGIYRHVKLVETKLLHIEKWGVFAHTPQVSAQRATVAIETAVVNEDKSTRANAVVKQILLDGNRRQVGTAESPIDVAAGASVNIKQEIVVDNPALWDIESPNLYTIETTIVSGRKQIDFVTNNIGIRSIEYDIDKGFILNGRQVKMKGVNLHHDGGVVGAAVPERVWERRFEVLKAGGCNAIRTAHNIPAPEVLDLCDRMGLLVMDEVFDEWEQGKRTYSYKEHFKDWYEVDLLSMVKRDRNPHLPQPLDGQLLLHQLPYLVGLQKLPLDALLAELDIDERVFANPIVQQSHPSDLFQTLQLLHDGILPQLLLGLQEIVEINDEFVIDLPQRHVFTAIERLHIFDKIAYNPVETRNCGRGVFRAYQRTALVVVLAEFVK